MTEIKIFFFLFLLSFCKAQGQIISVTTSKQDGAFNYTSSNMSLKRNTTAWEIPDVEVILVNDQDFDNQTSLNPDSLKPMILDIGSDAIGFPLSLYNSFLDAMVNYGVTGCTNSEKSVICLFSGDIHSLPTMYLDLNGKQLALPPHLYINDVSDISLKGSITLNLKGMDPSLVGRYWIAHPHNDHIILDSSFLKYHDTVFDTDDQTPLGNLVLQASATEVDMGPIRITLVLVIILIVLYLCALTYRFCCGDKKKLNMAMDESNSQPSQLEKNLREDLQEELQKDSRKASRKESRKDLQEELREDLRKDSQKDSRKGSRKESRKDLREDLQEDLREEL